MRCVTQSNETGNKLTETQKRRLRGQSMPHATLMVSVITQTPFAQRLLSILCAHLHARKSALISEVTLTSFIPPRPL